MTLLKTRTEKIGFAHNIGPVHNIRSSDARRDTMKKTLSIFLAAALLISFSFSQAKADPGKNHVLETVIIGTGVALLGAALIHDSGNHNRDRHYAHNYYEKKTPPAHHRRLQRHDVEPRGRQYNGSPYPAQRRKAFTPHKTQGRWMMQKVWVSPKYETRWVPGHLNKHNRWIKGHRAQVMVERGYWEKKRVWSRMDR